MRVGNVWILGRVWLRGAALFAVVWLGVPWEANAQTPYRRYTSPSGPTITPYLNYFRSDTGGVGDPYNAFIAPRRQLDSQLYQLGQTQQSDFQTGQRQIEQLRKSPAVPTGIGATFMNYSHYYPQPGQATKGKVR